MKNRNRCLLFLILSACWTMPAAAQTGVKVLQCGRLLDTSSGVARSAVSIVIRGSHIETVEEGFPAGSEDDIVDLKALTCLPGLVDAHAHLLASVDPRLNIEEALSAMLTKMSEADRVLLGVRNARELLQAGFTTARIVGHSGVRGDIALRDAIRAGYVEGPRLFASGRKLTAPGGQALRLRSALTDEVIATEYRVLRSADDARLAVQEAAAMGADWIKIVLDDAPPYLRLEEVRAVVEEAHANGLRVAAHASGAAAVALGVQANADSLEHGLEISDALLEQMARQGTFLVATDWVGEEMLAMFSEARNLNPEEAAELQAWLQGFLPKMPDRLQRARKAGVKIVGGSDMWWLWRGKDRGEASRKMLRALRANGLSPAEVLRAVTVTAAELLGWETRLGTVEPGKLADIIAVEGNPLEDFSALERVRFVMKDGKSFQTSATAK